MNYSGNNHGPGTYYLVPLRPKVFASHNGSSCGSGGIGTVLVRACSPEAARNILMPGFSGIGSREIYASPLFGCERMLLNITGRTIGVPEPFTLDIFATRRNGLHGTNVLALGQGVPPAVALVGRLDDVVASLNTGMLQI